MTKFHLLVLIHGMWGNPIHLAELERIVQETYSEPTEDGVRLHVLTAQTIREESTYDGVDWGGERVAQEVIDQVAAFEKDGDSVVRFSVTGYSLGGLIARYCIGVLHQRGFFEKIEAINFNTIATPHCGLPSYHTLISSITRGLGPKLLSRTGEQFYCVDKWSPKGRPLLVVMADPERVFYQALTKFKNLRIYANSVNDLTVPYVTAAIETTDPFAEEDINGIEIKMKEKYPCLIEQHRLPDVPPPKPAKPTALTPQWFKTLKPSKPLPPFLQFRFPLNIIFYSSLPILIPTILTMVLIRFTLASRSSRARVKQLEKESKESQTERLAYVLAELEHEMEEAVVDFIDNPDPSPSYLSSEKSRAHPIISPTHHKIANWLNQLPIQKELAYFPATRNSHAMIICRDVKRFDIHKLGEPLVRHWATSLVI
ncbi:hypothetical protein CVT24_003559 [Panaeolus cyanescens]|uniref:DUF676 domain-containing protein n=1 Tax=Panaeolus cyanescens TaxID=181874 RepID=A0A409Y788_9AGAR|nr:hypothetical protein CVT24_003559 [Panaeolus cyanescens]